MSSRGQAYTASAMPAPESNPVRPIHIALICVAVIAILFIGSIAVGVAVIEAEHASPASSSTDQQ